MNSKKYCSNCRLEINDKAKRCPYCGKRQYGNGIYIFLGVFILLGILAFIFENEPKSNTKQVSDSSIIAAQTKEQSSDDTKDEIKYIQVSSTDLIDQYNDNSVKCKQLYDGKLLEVTGEVQSVGVDVLGDTYVSLGHDTDFTFVGIQCYAKNDDVINKISELKEGDTITVQGKGDFNSFSFTLKNANIVE